MATKTRNARADLRNAVKPQEMLTEPVDDVEAEDQVITADQNVAIINLAREQMKLLKQIEVKEKELEELGIKLNKNKNEDLPKAMQDAGITNGKYPVGNDWSVELNSVVRASIPSPDNKKIADAVERNARGIAYLDQVAPDLVVTKLEIIFLRDEHKELIRFLGDNKRRKKPLEMHPTRTVHAGTLSKWVKEQDAAAKKIDEEAIPVYRVKVAEVVEPKKKKAL